MNYVNIKKKTLTLKENAIVEDTRFNRAAEDKEKWSNKQDVIK